MTMLEKVEIAMEQKRGELHDLPLAAIIPELARAALEAMREIPDSMYENYVCERPWRELSSKEVWRLWIDAALNDKA